MSIYSFINNGGAIAWIICGLSVIGLWQIAWKFITIHRFWKRERTTLPEKILGKLRNVEANSIVMLELIRTETSCAFAPLEKGITTISTIASTAPLLGLLGTVMGIFETFGMMAKQGTADPQALAGGINIALITTIVGLIVAIPHVVSYNYFISRIDSERNEIENEILKALELKLVVHS